MWSQQAGSKPAFRQGQGGGCSVRPGAGSSRGDFPCFLAQVVRELGSLFAPDQGCFSLDEKPQFWFDSKSMQSSMGQGTLPEKLPVLLTLRLGAFLFFGNVMSALTSADRCSWFIWKKSVGFKYWMSSLGRSKAGEGGRSNAESDADHSLGIHRVFSVLWVMKCSLEEKTPCPQPQQIRPILLKPAEQFPLTPSFLGLRTDHQSTWSPAP